MNILYLSKFESDIDDETLKLLSNNGFYISQSSNLNKSNNKLVDLYIIDENYTEFRDIFSYEPFLINIDSGRGNQYFEEKRNFLGYIDLHSSPLSLSSFLSLIEKDLHISNNNSSHIILKERFRGVDISFYDTMPYGVVFIDDKGEVLDINPAAERMFDVTEDEVKGLQLTKSRWKNYRKDGTLLEPYNHPGLVAIRTRKLVSNFIMGFDFSGGKAWVVVDAIPIINDQNKVEAAYIYYREITEEKNDHDLVHLYEAIFKNTTASIVVTDAAGVIETVNPRFIEMTGYSMEELIGKSPGILNSHKSNTDYEDMWKTISNGDIWNGEFYNRTKDGEYFSESSTIFPIKDENGKIIHYVGVKEDISELKKTQESLRESLDYLEEIVAAKTRSLKNAQLLTLESLATLSEYRDNETGAHIKRTKLYVRLMLEMIKGELDYKPEEIEQIWSSAPLHDIGKVAIPDAILLKPGKLTEEEFKIMREHPVHGNEALLRVSEETEDDSYLKYAKEITLFHHEKWDGSGYPYGLTGEDIPISARLMAIADVYDALRSPRPYKDGMDHETVVKMISEGSGSHFDPELVNIFMEHNSEFNNIYSDSMKDLFDISKLGY